MKKNPFIFAYFGNKRSEVEKIYEYLKDKLDNIDTIIEPFCGTSSISLYIALQHPLKYKYVLNDMDANLIELYKLMMDEERFRVFVNEFNVLVQTIINKEVYLSLVKKGNFMAWFIGRVIYSIRPNLWRPDYKPKTYNFDDIPIIKFLRTENITISQIDGTECFKQYQNDNKNLLLLDPPYLNCNNETYNKESRDNNKIYEYCANNSINSMDSLIVFILADNWILKLLFKENYKVSYEKQYDANGRKKAQHIIISNI